VTRPLVSVVIPVYNGERFLGQALESVLAQDYEPFETIVVDDGSVDRTPDIIRSFPSVRSIRQPNLGPSAARNAGIQLAAGEYVAFLDHDDVMTSNRLSVQLAPLRRDRNLHATIGSMEMFLEPGASWPVWARQGKEEEPGFYPTSIVARVWAIRNVGGFDVGRRIGEDWDLLLRFREAGFRIAPIPGVVVRRRFHGGNLTARAGPAPEQVFRMVKSWLDSKRQRGTEGALPVGRSRPEGE
jgi:glycosyltransferase involved in cell wall biosynthesis